MREGEVLALLADGRSNAEISQLENIAPGTVEKHIENIYPKLGVNNRCDAAIWYLKRKIARLERQLARANGSIAD